MTQPLTELLAENTKEGSLYKKLPDGRIECFACGHRCPIPEGKAGVCKVRFNQGGKLYAPHGYVGALQDDPIEKKPFFHVLPGAKALSFGMLGCDFHCAYCFVPETRIVSSIGPKPIEDIVEQKLPVMIYTHKGKRKKIKNYFKRLYRGEVLKIKPAFLPEIICTPDHPILAKLRPDHFEYSKTEFISANKLTRNHCLVIPKKYDFSENVVIKTRDYLEKSLGRFRVRHKIGAPVLQEIVKLSEKGLSSKAIGRRFNKSASHIRHLRSKIRNKKWDLLNLDFKSAYLVEDNTHVRLSKEHAPGLPKTIKLNKDFAEILGYYCAEGSVSRLKNRPHAANLNFAFSKKERQKSIRVKNLISKLFGVKAYLVHRPTTLAVSSSKTSLALLFENLCGKRGREKRVPEILFRAKSGIVKSFLAAYVDGDGYRTPENHVRISTISEELAWGIAWLVQKLGYLPQWYRYPAKTKRKLLGRFIRQAPWIYLVRWYEQSKKQRHLWEDDQYRYLLMTKIQKNKYKGPVYNLEIENHHSYLANFSSVHNCQNWVTSQTLRDPNAVSPPRPTTAKELVDLSLARECKVLVSTYNEPLITSEWAVEIFKEAKKSGLVTGYVSNGNATPEVLDFIRPYTDLYKIDLKGFDDKKYRELGGTLKNVCDSIRGVYERGFWLEIVTLLIPGFNDSDDEIQKLTEFIVSVSPDIPWHCTAFHGDYKMAETENTPAKTLLHAQKIGKQAGLEYIYPGNLPGLVGDGENTCCPSCGDLLIERLGYQVGKNMVGPNQGKCPSCSRKIPGRW